MWADIVWILLLYAHNVKGRAVSHQSFMMHQIHNDHKPGQECNILASQQTVNDIASMSITWYVLLIGLKQVQCCRLTHQILELASALRHFEFEVGPARLEVRKASVAMHDGQVQLRLKAVLCWHHLNHLHNVKTPFYCPQTFLYLNSQRRDDSCTTIGVSGLKRYAMPLALHR